MRRGLKSDDPELRDLPPEFRRLAQHEYLVLNVTGWRLQYSCDKWNAKPRELWQLHLTAAVPEEFSGEFASVHLVVFSVLHMERGDSTDSEPTPLGRVIGDKSRGEMTVELPTEVATFQGLMSALQANVDQTHTFFVRVTTEHSLSDLGVRGYTPVDNVIFDFVSKEEGAFSDGPQAQSQGQLIMLKSIRAALWIIVGLFANMLFR
jgi:hypothetical protein